MDLTSVQRQAKERMDSSFCRVCPVCNGIACRGVIPGPGGKGEGKGFLNNTRAWDDVNLLIDLIYEDSPIDTSIQLFGKRFDYPIFVAPIGAMKMHYGQNLTEREYVQAVVFGAKKANIAAFTGDGGLGEVFDEPIEAITNAGGWGIPTIKPWVGAELYRKLEIAKKSGAFAIAMDVDAAGLQHLKNVTPAIEPKTVKQLEEFIKAANLPVIIKGIMTPEGAKKALDAGAYGIVVSNHGGRVLDSTVGTATVLPQITKEVKGKLKIFVDGSIRSGTDVFKALALGADAALIGRPFVMTAFGGQADAVANLSCQYGAQLSDAMAMQGIKNLKEINNFKIITTN